MASRGPTHRPPAGPAQGALAGYYPSPGLGPVPLVGVCLWDEFCKPPGATTVGDLDWILTNAGTAPTVQNIVPTTDYEVGVTRLITNSNANVGEGGLLSWGANSMNQALPPGVLTYMKVRGNTTVQTSIFSGLAANNSFPTGATVCSAIGIRSTGGAAVGNWFFIVRNGAVETTYDTGLAASGTWRTFAIEKANDGSFLLWTLYLGNIVTGPQWILVANISGANAPTNSLRFVPLFVTSTILCTGTGKSADIDFWGVAGTMMRSPA